MEDGGSFFTTGPFDFFTSGALIEDLPQIMKNAHEMILKSMLAKVFGMKRFKQRIPYMACTMQF